ncbi:MAG: dethiobiotin synthase [Sandaracinaceae bacterium]|nr:dethiobiotin synthase [Sandaracinaceae bacterium]
MTRGLFVTATGTDCGKTWLARGIARALALHGLSVAALKPVETGVVTEPSDAVALARAARRPELATLPGLVRLHPPTSPYAASLVDGHRLPPLHELAHVVQRASREADMVLVEGAGGLLVPYDETCSLADLALELGFPLVLVARDALGTLSHVLTAMESVERRRLVTRAVVLVQGPWSHGDASVANNQRILAQRLPVPVLGLAASTDDDDALAAVTAPLLPVLLPGLLPNLEAALP